MMLSAADLPDLGDKTDVLTVKAWFEKLADLGIGFHADDGAEEGDVLDASAARAINAAMRQIRTSAVNWPDPDFIYDLAALGRFPIEKDYPGFIMDRSIPQAIGLNYPHLKGCEQPTFLILENMRFFALEIHLKTGRLSEAPSFRLIPASGVQFKSDGNIDSTAAILSRDEAIELSTLDALDDAIEQACVPAMGMRAN